MESGPVIGSILKDDPPPLSRLQPLAPPLLDRIVTRCLAKDPRDDYGAGGRDRHFARRPRELAGGPGKVAGRAERGLQFKAHRCDTLNPRV
jgi:hypothetical protein